MIVDAVASPSLNAELNSPHSISPVPPSSPLSDALALDVGQAVDTGSVDAADIPGIRNSRSNSQQSAESSRRPSSVLKGSAVNSTQPPSLPPSSWSPPHVSRPRPAFLKHDPALPTPSRHSLPSRPRSQSSRYSGSRMRKQRVPRRSRDGGFRIAGGPPDEAIVSDEDMDYTLFIAGTEQPNTRDHDTTHVMQPQGLVASASSDSAPPCYRVRPRRSMSTERSAQQPQYPSRRDTGTTSEAEGSDADTRSLRTLPPEYHRRYSVFGSDCET